MRTIITSADDDRGRLLIKSAEHTRHHQMARALERTLGHCSEIHAKCASDMEKLRESTKKEGFSAGFQLFFTQIVSLLDNINRRYNQRQTAFRQSLMTALEGSFHDPVVVERIIFYLQEICAPQSALNVVIPRGVTLPDKEKGTNYQYTDDNHITITDGDEVIRFPCEMLCQQWIRETENEYKETDQEIYAIIPEIMAVINEKLLSVSARGSNNHDGIIEEN